MKNYLFVLLFLTAIIFSVPAEEYIFTIPAGEDIVVTFPSVCLEYQKRTPEESDTYNTASYLEAEPYFEILLKLRDLLYNDAAFYKDQFNINYGVIKAEKIVVDERTAELAVMESRINSFDENTTDIDELTAYLDLLNKYIEAASNIYKNITVDMDNLPEVTESEKEELFRELIPDAFQYAVWIEDSKFQTEITGVIEGSTINTAKYEIAGMMHDAAVVLLPEEE